MKIKVSDKVLWAMQKRLGVSVEEDIKMSEDGTMNLYLFNKDIYVILITVEFDCTTYQAYCRNSTEIEKKVRLIFRDARDNYCEHPLLGITTVLIAKNGIKENRIDDNWFVQAGNCARGN